MHTIYIQMYTPTPHTHMQINAYTYVYFNNNIYTDAYLHIRTCITICEHRYTQHLIRTCIQTYIHKYTWTPHTHTHINIYTYVYFNTSCNRTTKSQKTQCFTRDFYPLYYLLYRPISLWWCDIWCHIVCMMMWHFTTYFTAQLTTHCTSIHTHAHTHTHTHTSSNRTTKSRTAQLVSDDVT